MLNYYCQHLRLAHIAPIYLTSAGEQRLKLLSNLHGLNVIPPPSRRLLQWLCYTFRQFIAYLFFLNLLHRPGTGSSGAPPTHLFIAFCWSEYEKFLWILGGFHKAYIKNAIKSPMKLPAASGRGIKAE
jgi:hypothetical protein